MIAEANRLVQQQVVAHERDDYRVILKDDGLELAIGSIGIQHDSGAVEYWAWAIDTVIPMREFEAPG